MLLRYGKIAISLVISLIFWWQNDVIDCDNVIKIDEFMKNRNDITT